MAEADDLGEAAFLRKYGFEPSRRYRIEQEGRQYASEAILAAAHGIQLPDVGPLRSSEFSGGRETTEKARALGFTIVETDAAVDDLGASLERFMGLFGEARGTKFSHDHPAVSALKACASDIEALAPAALRSAVVRPSVGQGNWAAVPWIAVLHPDVTTTTQHGVYPVLLFEEDLTAVEITIAQGVTDLKRSLGRRAAVQELDRRATLLREYLDEMTELGFQLDAEFNLGTSALARDYVASTVIHRRYERDSVATSDVSEAVASLLTSYNRLMQSGVLEGLSSADVTQVAPQALMIYVGQSADANFESGGRAGWWGWKQAPSDLEALRPGHLVAFGRGFDGGSPRVGTAVWLTHQLHEVVVGRVLETPERTDRLVMPDEIAGDAAYPWKMRFEILGAEGQVPLAAGNRLSESASERAPPKRDQPRCRATRSRFRVGTLGGVYGWTRHARRRDADRPSIGRHGIPVSGRR